MHEIIFIFRKRNLNKNISVDLPYQNNSDGPLQETQLFFYLAVFQTLAVLLVLKGSVSMRRFFSALNSYNDCGRPWPAAYITFMQNTHQMQVLTEPLCRAQAIFYSLPNNEWGTKYRGLTYSAKLTVRESVGLPIGVNFALSLI